MNTTTPFVSVLILCLSLHSGLFAQIVLDKNDLPHVGLEFYINRVESVPLAFDMQLNQEVFDLDVSELTVNGTDTTAFVEPSSRPEGHLFPEAELALINLNDGELTMNYLKQTEGTVWITGLYIDLYSDGQLRDIHLDPFGTLMHAPMQFSAAYSESHAFVDTVYNPATFNGVDTLILTSIITTDEEVDGYGTVTIPGHGTFDVLRVRVVQEHHDTARAHMAASNQWVTLNDGGKSYGYLYYAKGQGIPLVRADLTSSGYVREVLYVNNPRPIEAPTSVHTPATDASLCVYPNPSRRDVTLKYPHGTGIQSYVLYDAHGRMVARQDQVASGTQQLSLDPIHDPGLYHLMVETDTGTITRSIYITR